MGVWGNTKLQASLSSPFLLSKNSGNRGLQFEMTPLETLLAVNVKTRTAYHSAFGERLRRVVVRFPLICLPSLSSSFTTQRGYFYLRFHASNTMPLVAKYPNLVDATVDVVLLPMQLLPFLLL